MAQRRTPFEQIVRAEDLVGTLVVPRRTPGEFAKNTTDIIKTFRSMCLSATPAPAFPPPVRPSCFRSSSKQADNAITRKKGGTGLD